MIKQEAVSKTKGEPKPGKRWRPKEQIDRVKERGERLAGMAGVIIALSSIRPTVLSQTVCDLRYIVTPSSRGLICQCDANAGGKMTAGMDLEFVCF